MSVTAVVGQTPKCCPGPDEGRVDPGGCEVDPGDDGAAVVLDDATVGDVTADEVLGSDTVLSDTVLTVGVVLGVGAVLEIGGTVPEIGAVLDPRATGAGVEPQPATSTRRAAKTAIGRRAVIGVTPCPPMVRPALRRPARIVGPVT